MKIVKILGGLPHVEHAFDDLDYDGDIWWLNDFHKTKTYRENADRITRWFEMHTFTRMNRRWNWNKIEWLEDEDRNFQGPIYMRRQYRRVPGSVAYPIRAVASQVSTQPLRTLFGCSHSMMIGLAILQSYDRIELYGVNLSTPVETYLEKPSAAFWLGVAAVKGIEVDTTHSPALMPEILYGFKDRLFEVAETNPAMPQSVYMQLIGVEYYNSALDPHDTVINVSQVSTAQKQRSDGEKVG